MTDSHWQTYGDSQYYSPNSTHQKGLIIQDAQDANPFIPRASSISSVRYDDLCVPRRWTRPFGWLCCLPLQPRLRGYPLDILAALPEMRKVNNGEQDKPRTYRIDERSQQHWRTLEHNLYTSVVSLKGRYSTPMVLPFLPFGLGYCDAFTCKSLARKCLKESRAWFSVWAGALTYAIALAITHQEEKWSIPYRKFPEWQAVLSESGLDASWIDGIQYSSICDFQYPENRVGCVVDIIDPDPYQPPVDWFIDHGIPVWYRWGAAEQRLAARDMRFAKLAPKSTRGFALEGSLRRGMIPDLAPGSSIDTASSVTTELEHATLPTIYDSDTLPTQFLPAVDTSQPAWVAFFDERQKRHASILLKETPVQKQRRENRTREPPTASAPVFEWWLSGNDGCGYERVPVRPAFRAETLELYHPRQKLYDPFFNEWDCCDQFEFNHSGPEDDDDEEEVATYENSGSAANHQLWVVPNPDNFGGSVLTQVNPIECTSIVESPPLDAYDTQPDRPSTLLHAEVQDIFGYHYGFCGPVPTVSPPLTSASRSFELFLRTLGSTALDASASYFQTSHYATAQAFFDSLVQRQSPPAGMCDFLEGSILPVNLLPRFKCVTRLPVTNRSGIDNGEVDNVQCYYIFDFPDYHLPWKLAVLSPENALLICRLPAESNPETIVYFLAQRAIPFRILTPCPPISRPVFSGKFHFQLPVRRLHHKFTKYDYESYVNVRTYLLGQPHMQAALRRGGIVWRLSISVLGLNNILKPATQHGGHLSLSIPGSSQTWVDDSVTKHELDLLCGVYECIADDGRQRASKSWWPPALYYEKDECGENYGRWSERRETWYTERLKAIEHGTDDENQPLTYTQWKSCQHGVRMIRTFHREIHTRARHLLETHVQSG